MLKEKKTYKDDMLVGDLVENREFDVNCNFEIYDCTEKGSDWQKGAKKIFSTINEGWVIDGRETTANLRLFRRLLDVYGESEIPSTSGEGERKFIFDSSHFALVTRLQTGDFQFSVSLVTTPDFGRGVIDLY